MKVSAKVLFAICLFIGVLSLPAEAATTTSITQYGITWTFSQAVEYGQFVTGDYWVVGPVTLNSVSPGWDGLRHGSMVDPAPSSGVQGYRSGLTIRSAMLHVRRFRLS